MIDSEQLLVVLCGEDKLAAFKEVKLTSMRMARVVREAIADELDGSLPSTGKQFMTTARGTWRLASRPNSDNTTEEGVHRRMGVGFVQVFGELADFRRAKGWMSLEDLYAIHGVPFKPARLLRKVAKRMA
jgi:hypothetical protein